MPTCVDCNGYFSSIHEADRHVCKPVIPEKVKSVKAYNCGLCGEKIYNESTDHATLACTLTYND